MPDYPYVPDRPPMTESPEALRARIPGWGADLDPADRPAVPRELPETAAARGRLPEQQPETRPRERSIEHARLTPVFGTAQPLSGAAGTIRRLAYARYSEGRAAHWLLLLAADRVDVAGSVARAWATGRPENPLVETGLASERHHGLRSRIGRGRADLVHQPLDPVVVAAPWLVAGYLAYRAARAIAR